MIKNKDSSICLISPLHDPHSRLLEEIQNNGKKLNQIYKNQVIVSVTEDTSTQIIEALKIAQINFEIKTKKSGLTLGDNIRNTIKLGLKLNTDYLHFIDFDRALHWAKRYPDELRKTIEQIKNFSGYISLVRTQTAFETHPFVQRSTESTINTIASEIAEKNIDIMSGSFALDKKTAQIIFKKSKQDRFGIYAEIFNIAHKNKININSLMVDGLEWETPDQFKDKIEEEGYITWLQEFESLPEWQKRVRLIEESVDVLIPH